MRGGAEAPSAATRSGRPSLHLRIRDDLAERIRSGAWPPGYRIPFEHELMKTYGCARATASRAVQDLANAGLIERRRRAGSFVAAPRAQTAVLEIPDLRSVIVRRGQAHAWALGSRLRRAPRPGDADEGALAPRGDVLEIHGRHLADDRPFALEARIIDLGGAPGAADADFGALSPGAWLLDHVPWSAAEHRIRAIAAGPDVARMLDLAPGAACLRLNRWTWRGGVGVTFVSQVFPADAFELVARFSPGAF